MSEHVPGPEKENVKEEVAVAASPEMLQRVETMTMMMGRMSKANPLAEKITTQHIDKILDLEKEKLSYSFKSEKGNKWLFFGIFIVACILLTTLVVFLTNNNRDALLMDIIKILLGFAGGFGVGISAKFLMRKD